MPVYRASDILNQLARIRGQVKESLGGRPDLQSSSASECTGAEHQVPASKKAELWKKWIPAARPSLSLSHAGLGFKGLGLRSRRV
ncbi:unnamed protein product [Symbiodinium microadriaticum]|nr:unnamed protein product [Symbiodinium microadriaticum]